MSVPNALIDCWAIIEEYTDAMSLVSASNTCETLHNLVRIKCTDLTIGCSGLKMSNALDNTSTPMIEDNVPKLVQSIHFPALINLTIKFPNGTSGTRVATEIATKIEHAKNVSSKCMPVYFCNYCLLCLM